MNYIKLLFAFLFCILLVTNLNSAENKFKLTKEEQLFIDKLNDLRKLKKLPPVIVSEKMTKDCRLWASIMEKTGVWGHAHNRENCAMNSAYSGEYTYRQWQRSPGHRAFLNNISVNYVGIGHVGRHWVYRGASEIKDYKSGKEAKL